MTDPLSVAASVIAVATLAAQSCKATYTLVDSFCEAPRAVAHSKGLLRDTQNTLNALEQILKQSETPGASEAIESVVQKINLNTTLQSTHDLCDEFSTTVARMSKHSTDVTFSKRDRLAFALRETKIQKFNQQLCNCQRTVSLVVGSMDLIISSRTSSDVKRLGDHFRAQEQALINMDAQLRNMQISFREQDNQDADDKAENIRSDQLSVVLQEVCQQALAATEEKRTGQSFGDMLTDDMSIAMQGIVGLGAGNRVEQSFGRFTTTKSSRAFQGQMTESAFATMFG